MIVLSAVRELAIALLAVPPARRSTAIRDALAFLPSDDLSSSFAIGQIRLLASNCWEELTGGVVPFKRLRRILGPQVTSDTIDELSELGIPEATEQMAAAIVSLFNYLCRCQPPSQDRQQNLFTADEPQARQRDLDPPASANSTVVTNLQELIREGREFRTIYADPPWQYQNSAARGAAENHYRTMTLNAICAEPVKHLVADNAHLHLWTTNGLLREAFDVIEAWGFEYRSCFVWVKDIIGTGNYWRVSHEFLMLGVRGSLTFRRRTERSWRQWSRTVHSRKPGAVRLLIEQVSPGPFLEMYGREEIPNSPWTVYGNCVESRLF